MSNYITAIHVKELRHLHNIDIKLSKDTRCHLLITGKNGSGKTSLLDAIAKYLEAILNVGTDYTLRGLEKLIKQDENNLENQKKNGDLDHVEDTKQRLEFYNNRKNELYGALQLDFVEENAFKNSVKSGEFIVAYYKDYRNPHFIEPKSPELPEYGISTQLMNDTKENQFLKLLVYQRSYGCAV